jgi:hypothetical protein
MCAACARAARINGCPITSARTPRNEEIGERKRLEPSRRHPGPILLKPASTSCPSA